MELEQSRSLLESSGVRIAAVSYDSGEILAAFAQKHSIGYPLLSDHGSEVIRRFGIFNANMAPELRSYGVPHPVEYLISADGIVVKKYFVSNYQHRVTGSTVALEQFGECADDAPLVRVISGALEAQIGLPSGRAFAGQEISFFARFILQRGWHVYGTPAPEGSTATSIVFEGAEILQQDVTFPVLSENSPVYIGSFQARGRVLLRFPLKEGQIVLHGNLSFQKCSATVCEPPETISFQIPLTLEPFLISDHDRQLAKQP